jgi:phage terminase small subunit
MSGHGKKTSPKPDRAGLTPRQARFVQEYLLDLNATQAAIRAGYSAKTAEQQGSRLLSFVGVRGAVDEALAARAQRVEVKQDDVLRELLRIARADARTIFDENGQLKPPREWSDDAAAFLSSVEVEELFDGRGAERRSVGFVRKVKLWPKVQALELLGKHLRLWVERAELTGKDGGPLAVQSTESAGDDKLKAAILAGLDADGELAGKLLAVIAEHKPQV